jgi:hypothetical protein
MGELSNQRGLVRSSRISSRGLAPRRLGLSSGKNGNASKLIDAAIWIFIVAGFSIVTSVFYVFGLSVGLNFEFRIYFGIKDYLEVTPYWLGPFLVTVIVLMVIFYGVKYLKDKDFFRLKREPGQKWLPLFVHRLGVVHSILAASIVCFGASFVLGLFLFFIIAPTLAFAGLLVLAATSGLYWVLNTKVSEGFGGSLVGKIRSQPFLWRGVKLVLNAGLYAALLGGMWEPVAFWNKPISTIYLAGSNFEVQGRVLFSLTQYLMTMREDGTVVAIPVTKVDRIETLRNQTIGSKPAPTPTLIQTTTPTPLSTPTPTPNTKLSSPAETSLPVSATPAPRLSPVSTPTLAPSPKRGRSPG